MLFVPRQVALAVAAAAMSKEEAKKEKKSKSKAAAKGSAAAAPDARAVVVASVGAFLEAGGFPRALAALQSEANLEASAWRSSPVSLEDLVSKFLESSDCTPVAVTAGSDGKDKTTDSAAEEADKKKKKKGGATEVKEAENNVSAPSAIQEDETREKKKKKKKGGAEASESESKACEPSAQEKPSENAGSETKEKKKKDGSSVVNAGSGEANETVKSDDQKLDGKKKKNKKRTKDDDVEARLEKVELVINNKFEAAEKLKEDGNKSREEEPKSQNDDADKNSLGNGALDKAKKKKKGKSATETSEKTDAVAAPAEDDGANGKSDAVETVKDGNEKKAKKKRKKSDSEENVHVEGKEVAGKDSVPKADDENKSGMEIEGENGRPSSENAVVGKKRKLEEVEGSIPPAKENSATNPSLSNGFAEDNTKEDSTIKPSKRQKHSSEPKTVNAFQRVKIEDVKFADERLQDNSYWAKSGAESGYGAKAQEVLGQVRGRGFRHEKTKKKRGTYRGGQIDLQTHSIKFNDSDDE
ncbi:suppressor protein SRP40-like [Phragmites australis]|uniref:suppressor protein SRP40-like n=1 Tax=Phragmites australis TaxID=29695 RepID=UPI002D78D98A|nr:suppressor protein SRP40-like [Phragmites australis]